MRLRFLESPLQRLLDHRAEYDRPVSAAQAEDALHVAAGVVRREAPNEAAACQREMRYVLDKVTAHDGQLTLRGIQHFINDPWGDTFGRRELLPDDRVAELSIRALRSVLVSWANDGRPELAADHKRPLDVGELRATLDSGALQAEDSKNARALLDALGDAGGPISWRRIERFGAELDAAVAAGKNRSIQRMHAGMVRDEAAAERLDELAQRSAGAKTLSKMLGFFADQGELGKLAADVKPGATRVLGGAL